MMKLPSVSLPSSRGAFSFGRLRGAPTVRRAITTSCLAALTALVSGCGPERVGPAPRVSAQEEAGESEASAQPSEAPSADEPIDAQAFRLAAHDGKIDEVRQAIESGIDVHQADPQLALTALHMAAYNGHSEIVRLLLDQDVEVDPRDHEGKTPLIHACTGPFPETVQVLIDAGADVNARESTEAFTPLMMGAGLGNLEVVKVLLEHDADKTLTDDDGETALDHARNSGHAEIVALLGG